MKTSPSGHGQRGFTLNELLITFGLTTLLAASFLAANLTLQKTFIAVSNYDDLNNLSRNTLDYMTRDIRNTTSVGASSTTTRLTLTNLYGGARIVTTYNWDGSNVIRSCLTITNNTSYSERETLLTSCDYLAFAYYQRNPTNNYSFYPTTAPDQIKLVSVSWHCSREILGSKINTESVQTANVVIRN